MGHGRKKEVKRGRAFPKAETEASLHVKGVGDNRKEISSLSKKKKLLEK